MAYPPITTLPAAPSRQDPANFADEADAFLGALPTFGTQANALASYVDGVAAAVDTDATNAAASAEAAAASETAAIAAAGAVAWVSGSSYTIGDTVWSPTNFQTYRAKTTHSGVSTDPLDDTTNWEVISFSSALISGLVLTASGAITAGRAVSLNSDGTVSVPSGDRITLTALVDTGDTDPQNGSGPFVYAGSNTYVFTYYVDATTSLYVIAGTRNSDDTFTLGSPVLVGTTTSTAGRRFDIAYDSSESKFIVAFCNAAASDRPYYAIGTLSGTTISLGTATLVNATNLSVTVGVATNDNGTAFFVWGEAANVLAKAMTISTESLGAVTTVDNQNAVDVRALWDSVNSTFVWISVLAEVLTIECISYTGTTIGTQSGNLVVNSAVSNVKNIYVPQVIGDGTIKILTVPSGEASLKELTITLNGTVSAPTLTESLELSNSVLNPAYAFYDTDSSSWFVFNSSTDQNLYISSNQKLVRIPSTIDTEISYLGVIRGNFGFYDSANKIGISPFWEPVSDNPYIAVTKTDVPSLATYIGIANTSVADGESVIVNVIGDVNESVSGLNIGRAAYVSIDGVVGSTGDGVVGKAVSATSFLLTSDPYLI